MITTREKLLKEIEALPAGTQIFVEGPAGNLFPLVLRPTNVVQCECDGGCVGVYTLYRAAGEEAKLDFVAHAFEPIPAVVLRPNIFHEVTP